MGEVSTTSKAIALILAAAIVVLLPATILAYNIQQHLMNPETYKDAFVQQELYSRIPELAALQMTKNLDQPSGEGENGSAEILRFMGQDDWTLIFEEVLDEDWSRRQVEHTVDGLFAFFNGETETVEASISLLELKAALSGPEGEKLLKMMFGSLPACTLDDVAEFIAGLIFGGELRFPACSLPDEVLDPILSGLHELLVPAVGAIPDDVPLNISRQNFDFADPDKPGETGNLVDIYRTVRAVFRFGPWVVVILLVLIAAFTVRSWRGLLGWWGWPLFIGGALIYVPVLTRGSAIVRWLEDYLFLRAPQGFSIEIVDTATRIVGQIATDTLRPVGMHAVILMSAGLAMVVVEFMLRRRDKAEAAAAAPGV